MIPDHIFQRCNMPYIKKEDRKAYDSLIEDVVDALTNHGYKLPEVGHINYVISKIIWSIFKKKVSYTTGNNLMGVLECVKAEFYRRHLAVLEDNKIIENGDI